MVCGNGENSYEQFPCPRNELELTWEDATNRGARMSEMKKFHWPTLSFWNR